MAQTVKVTVRDAHPSELSSLIPSTRSIPDSFFTVRLIAMKGKTRLGCLVATMVESEMQIHRMIILPSSRREGVASLLIQRLEIIALALQRTALSAHVVETNEKGIRCLHSLGFAGVRTIPGRSNRWDYIRMKKTIATSTETQSRTA